VSGYTRSSSRSFLFQTAIEREREREKERERERERREGYFTRTIRRRECPFQFYSLAFEGRTKANPGGINHTRVVP